MSIKDRLANKIQEAKGKGKEAVGSAVGNKNLEAEGQLDQTKAGFKNAGESIKDAVEDVKDAVQGH